VSVSEPSPAQRRLGARLRELRGGIGQVALAEQLSQATEPGESGGWSQSKVSKVENGKHLPTPDEIRAWARLTGADPAELLELREQASVTYDEFRASFAAPGGAGKLQESYLEDDENARLIFEYQPGFIIGWGQTDRYTEELLRLPSGPGSAGASDAEIATLILRRRDRQNRLWETGPRRPDREVGMIMGEAAIHQRVGSEAVMRGQLDHLAGLARRHTWMTIGVIPLSAPMPIAPVSGFLIHDDVVRIETLGGVLEVVDPAQVAVYHECRRRLLEAAVTGDALADLLYGILDGQ
jgi:transcriptional regulator with XRE-family HTH domain